jgi:MerR family transcriptional regulator/heat shock protein HspR
VNLAGVEIILNMREKMAAIERQVEEFVRTLNEELAVHLPTPSKEERNSLIPVIALPSVTPVRPNRKESKNL